MRLGVLALLSSVLAAVSCSPAEAPSCPGTTVAVLQLKGQLVRAGDLLIAGLDPVPALPDCTPDLNDASAPIRYPRLVGPFEAKLSADPATSDAALCRSNGVVYAGQRTGSSYALTAEADPAILCNSVCAAGFRVVIDGNVASGTDGAPTGFQGILVEVLTASRGACDGCLPLVPGTDPAELACAGRYALTGTPH